MAGIRKAILDDAPVLFALLKQFHAESIYRTIPIDEDVAKNSLSQCLKHPDRICVFVYESGLPQIDGLLIGQIMQYPFSTEKGAWDLGIYVRPERRGSLIA